MIAKRLRSTTSLQLLQRPSNLVARSLAAHRLSQGSLWLQSLSLRRLAMVRDHRDIGELWFAGNQPKLIPESPELREGSNGENKPPDDRTLKLGKTVRILQERLPNLLAGPLPQEILSPQISLHLFPSTHPHLPTVTGRISYTAALWTAPMAWGRVPVVGNVRLIILSERMVKNGSTSPKHRNEKLIVRWRTCGKTKGRGMGAFYRGIGGGKDGGVDKITEVLQGHERDDEEFSGIFIFEFDEEGRIVQHTIEHAQQGGNFERMTRVVSVTDWLLGLTKRQGESSPGYALGYCETESKDPRRRVQDKYRE